MGGDPPLWGGIEYLGNQVSSQIAPGKANATAPDPEHPPESAAPNLSGDDVRASGKAIIQSASIHLCGKGTVLVMNERQDSFTVIPVRCRSWKCPRCGPPLRAQWAHRIAEARPERFLTVTTDSKRFSSPAQAYEHLRIAFPVLIRQLRKLKIGFEYCAIWEPTEQGYPHIHIAQKGNYVPKKLLSALWDQLGCGPIVDIQAIKHRGHTAKYVTKYMTAAAAHHTFLPRRHRIIQYSRHFFPKPPNFTPALSPEGSKASFVLQHPSDVLRILHLKFDFTITYHPASMRWTAFRPSGALTEAQLTEVAYAF